MPRPRPRTTATTSTRPSRAPAKTRSARRRTSRATTKKTPSPSPPSTATSSQSGGLEEEAVDLAGELFGALVRERVLRVREDPEHRRRNHLRERLHAVAHAER